MWTPARAVQVARTVSIAALTIAVVPAVQAAPLDAAPVPYAGAVPLPEAELAHLRGGLMVAGLNIDFGAMVTVAVNGSQVAQTVFQLNDNGQVTGQTAIASVLPAGVTVQAVTGNGVQSGNVSIQTLPSGTQGVVITNAAGQTTAALTDIALNHTSSLLVNAASNQAVQQTVTAQLAINNYSQMMQTLQPQLVASALTRTAAASAAVGLH